jgi:hypothetical protein
MKNILLSIFKDNNKYETRMTANITRMTAKFNKNTNNNSKQDNNHDILFYNLYNKNSTRNDSNVYTKK